MTFNSVVHQVTDTGIVNFHFDRINHIKLFGIYFNTFSEYLTLNPSVRKPHTHDCYSILILTKCNGAININNNAFPVSQGTICLIAPDQVHSFEDIREAKGFVILFYQDFYVQEFSLIRLLSVFSTTVSIDGGWCRPVIEMTKEDFRSVLPIIKAFRNEFEAINDYSAFFIRSVLNTLLLKVSDFCAKKFGNSASCDNVFIYKISQLVDSHFIREQNVNFYTSACNVSESRMNDLCNKYFKCGLKKILQNRLMQEARKLLVTSEMSISEIAYTLNFKDDSYFNRIFKKKAGITPRQFRELHKRFIQHNT